MIPVPTRFPEIAGYLAGLRGEVANRMADLCQTIEDEVPLAEGRLSYHMPAYFFHGSLVYFSAFKNHIGFYPASAPVFDAFRDELAPYKQSGRGTVQFLHKEPVPLALVRRMVAFRAKENLFTVQKATPKRPTPLP